MSELEELKQRMQSRQLGHNRNHRGTGDLLREVEADLKRVIAIAVELTGKAGRYDAIHEQAEKQAAFYNTVVQERDEARALAECDVCHGTPHPSGLPCVCGGTNTAQAASLFMRKERIPLLGERDQARADVLALRDAVNNNPFVSKLKVLAETESYEAFR